jgi:hypothetical protein
MIIDKRVFDTYTRIVHTASINLVQGLLYNLVVCTYSENQCKHMCPIPRFEPSAELFIAKPPLHYLTCECAMTM